MLLAHGYIRRLLVLQVEVKNACLNGLFAEEIYMHQPEGFFDERHPHFVCTLKRTLECLKQTSSGFYSALNEALGRIRHALLRSDPVIFFGENNRHDTRVAAYADYALIVGHDRHLLEKIIGLLWQRFALKEFGEASEFVGIDLVYDKRKETLSLSQMDAIQHTLK